MKILLTTDINDVLLNGLLSGFKHHEEHNLIKWEHKDISLSDVIYHNDDLKMVIIHTNLITDTVFNVCKKNNIKIVSYGLTNHAVDVQLIQGINSKLQENIQGKFFVLDKYVNDNFYIGPFDKNKRSDLLVLSNYAISQECYHKLLDIVHAASYNLKIIGRHSVNMPQYLGETTIEETMSFVGSTTLLLDYDEKYTKECIYSGVRHLGKFNMLYEITDKHDEPEPNEMHNKVGFSLYEPYSKLLEQIL